MHTIAEVKRCVLSLEDPRGVSRETFFKITAMARDTMGADAADILSDAIECDEDNFYFPKDGNSIKAWKCMMRAYKDEKAIA